MIIHITGSPGSGKSALCQRFAKFYKTQLIVKHLRELLTEFLQEYECGSLTTKEFASQFADLYQAYITQYLTKHKTRDIIFIGAHVVRTPYQLDFRGAKITCPESCYNLNATHRIYIQLPINNILKAIYDREYGPYVTAYYNNLLTNKDNIYKLLIKSNNAATNSVIAPLLAGPFDIISRRADILACDEFYLKRGYNMVPSESVYSRVRQLILKNSRQIPMTNRLYRSGTAFVNVGPEYPRQASPYKQQPLARTASPSRTTSPTRTTSPSRTTSPVRKSIVAMFATPLAVRTASPVRQSAVTTRAVAAPYPANSADIVITAASLL